MKKLIIVLFAVVMLAGCAGMNATIPVNVAADIAFVAVLQNNPQYKAPVVAALNTVKVYLSGSVTYDDLLLLINKQLGGKYAYIGLILVSYLDTDKPLFETYLPMTEAYRISVIKKIDRLLLIANTFVV